MYYVGAGGQVFTKRGESRVCLLCAANCFALYLQTCSVTEPDQIPLTLCCRLKTPSAFLGCCVLILARTACAFMFPWSSCASASAPHDFFPAIRPQPFFKYNYLHPTSRLIPSYKPLDSIPWQVEHGPICGPAFLA